MHKYCLLVVLVILQAQYSWQRGTIYLNEIQPIPDVISGVAQIPIECTLWVDTTLYLDFFDGIPAPGTGGGSGIDVDGVLNNGGTWIFPNELVVGNNVEMAGLLQPDGGFFADDGDIGDANNDGLDFAFSIEDNSGTTVIAGTLDIAGGLTNQDDISTPFSTFTVEDNTGLTTIEGLLRPNGGIIVQQGIFSATREGVTFGEGDLFVEGDLFFGDESSSFAHLRHYSNRFVGRPNNGGSLTLQGQDASQIGGDLVFSPGFAVGASDEARPGRILLGIFNEVHDLYLSRQTTSSGNAGKLVLSGQRSSANAGAFELRGGNSVQGGGSGGNIVLTPGKSEDSSFGRIFLGNPSDGPNIPFIMRRPDIVDSAGAGDTFFYGQDTFDSRAGDTIFSAGNGNLAGGNIYLEPGNNGPLEGRIIFGNKNQTFPELVTLTRTPTNTPSDGSDTWLIGQDSVGADGGDFFFIAGDASDVADNGFPVLGGSIFLLPGLPNSGGRAGRIIWGNSENNAELFVLRPPTNFQGRLTSIIGQSVLSPSANLFAGGDLTFEAGGGFLGGNLFLAAGNGDKLDGGLVQIRANSDAVSGGDVQISAGSGPIGGSLFLFAGNAGPLQGSIPDTPPLPGDIVFRSTPVNWFGAQFILDAVPFITNSDVRILDPDDPSSPLDIFGTPSRVLEFGPVDDRYALLIDRQTISNVFQNPFSDLQNPYNTPQTESILVALETAINQLNAILEAHGLILIDD